LAGRLSDEEGYSAAAYIEQDFRKYLACGILAHGFSGLDVLAAITISLSHSPVKGVVFVPPVIPPGVKHLFTRW